MLINNYGLFLCLTLSVYSNYLSSFYTIKPSLKLELEYFSKRKHFGMFEHQPLTDLATAKQGLKGIISSAFGSHPYKLLILIHVIALLELKTVSNYGKGLIFLHSEKATAAKEFSMSSIYCFFVENE